MSNNQLSTSTLPKSKIGRRKWAKPAVYAGLVVIMALLPVFLSSAYMLHILILIFIYIIAAVSLRTITISGQFPLAHAAFMGIGAYLAGMAVGLWDKDQIAKQKKKDRSFSPLMDEGRRDTLYAGWQKAVKRTMKWLDEET